MITMHVSHHYPAHVGRIEAKSTNLCTGFLFWSYPTTFAGLHKWVPPRLIVVVVRMRTFTRIYHDQALWMLDQPATNWEERSPVFVFQNVLCAGWPGNFTRHRVQTLDLHITCLNVVDVHDITIIATFVALMSISKGR